MTAVNPIRPDDPIAQLAQSGNPANRPFLELVEKVWSTWARRIAERCGYQPRLTQLTFQRMTRDAALKNFPSQCFVANLTVGLLGATGYLVIPGTAVGALLGSAAQAVKDGDVVEAHTAALEEMIQLFVQDLTTLLPDTQLRPSLILADLHDITGDVALPEVQLKSEPFWLSGTVVDVPGASDVPFRVTGSDQFFTTLASLARGEAPAKDDAAWESPWENSLTSGIPNLGKSGETDPRRSGDETPWGPPPAQPTDRRRTAARGARPLSPPSAYDRGVGEPIEVHPAQLEELEPFSDTGVPNAIDYFLDLPITLTVELGQAEITLGELLTKGKGDVIELNSLAGQSVVVKANGKLIALAEVVIYGDSLGIRFIEIASQQQRLGAARQT